ncbi:MAG: hypothetical protein K2I79_02620 [Clostridia bacterium]|nr:hypothetical protein [Clostridia bacterium]
MQDNNRFCYNCRYLQRYYVRGDKQFSKTKFGFCIKLKSNVHIRDFCTGYEYRPRLRVSYKKMEFYLNNLLTELSSIRTFIETKDNEDEKEC